MISFHLVGVIAKREGADVPTLRALVETLHALGCEVLVETNPALGTDFPGRHVTRSALAAQAQLAVVVGGDGTLLSAGRALAPARLPLLGVNQGRLGFLVDVNPGQMRDSLSAVVEGRYEIDERLILNAVVQREGRALKPPQLAVNDVVLRNQASIRMLEFETWLDDEFISAHRADGMIVSSPTGSTAYALSGGGPLLHPSLQAMALVPICPHTLSDRPIVVGAGRSIRLVVRGQGRAQATATFDGQISQSLEPGDTVVVRRHEHSLQLIHPPGFSYFGLLRDKLRWGSGPRSLHERA